jgi:large subunit ribosomal protein LP0
MAPNISKQEKKAKKVAYRARMLDLLAEYKRVLVVKADNVSSNQFHQLRKDLRGRAIILMGKNTQQRKSIAIAAKNNPKLRSLSELLRLNVGLVFTHDDLSEIRKTLLANVVGAPAKVGATSPCNVVVPAGNTGLEPGMTSFFQALNIPTKITKGTVEIQNDVTILKTGDRVGQSEATLLAKLNIKPFTYGLKCISIYDDGAVYDADLLDIKPEDVSTAVSSVIAEVAAISLALNFPTLPAVPTYVGNAYQELLAVALATEYSFPLADKYKEFLKNPGAAAVATSSASTSSAPAAKAAEPAAKKAPEPEPEPEDDDMGFSLFD